MTSVPVGLRPTITVSPGRNVPQPRGQRPVRHLDAQELQMVSVVGADDAGEGRAAAACRRRASRSIVKWPLEKRSAGSRAVVVKVNKTVGPAW